MLNEPVSPLSPQKPRSGNPPIPDQPSDLEAERTEPPILDAEPVIPAIDLVSEVIAATRATGKGAFAVIRDMLWTMRRSPGKLSIDDYCYYRLWDENLAPGEAKLDFVGRGLEQTLHMITADPIWIGVFHDKLLNYHVLQEAGFPVPETIALYRHNAALPRLRCLPDPQALAQFLGEPGATPWFGKPVTGMRSAGTVRAEAYDPSSNEMVFAGGRRATPDAFVAALERYATDGYLFQKILAPHPEIGRLTAGHLAGVRLIVLLERSGPSLHRALLKIPVGGNIADNFWRTGNLLAALDSESGRITRAVFGVGQAMQEVEVHPDTGIALSGVQMPDWGQTVEICLSAATLFPRIRMQAWDVALCATGPVIVEANVGGDFNLPQIAHGKGMLTAEFRAFLVGCAAERGGAIRRAAKRFRPARV